MTNPDFKFRNPLGKASNPNLSRELNRINKIGSSNFSPLNESKNNKNLSLFLEEDEEEKKKGVMEWLTTATTIILGVSAFVASFGTFYTAVRDWFSGRREFKHEVKRLQDARQSDKGAKEFFAWLPKSKTFSQMQNIMKEIQRTGSSAQLEKKKTEVTNLFINEVKAANLSKNAIYFIAKELRIKPEYLHSGIKYGSSSAIISGIGSSPDISDMGESVEGITEAVNLDPTEREIFLYTVNHNGIYRSRITPIIDNYKKKISGGKFDRNLATKGFTYAVEDGIKEYNKENGTTIKMSPASRMRVAEKMLEYYGEEIGMAARNVSIHKEDVADEIKLSEVSPPSGPARRFTKKPEVKAAFKKRYGVRWKEVMYATGWKMHNK